jgi:hypothetical protein
VRLQVSDGSLTYEKSFTISVTNVNEEPTDIELSNSSIAENAGANAVVGALSGTDADLGTTLKYSLVAGAGDTDNAAFNISDTTLRATASFNFESKSSYSVRVQVSDGSLTCEKLFAITVTNVNDAPTATATPLNLKTGQTSKVTIKGTDEDKDKLVYSIFVAPTQGKATINAQTGELSYTAPSKPVSERIVIRVSDGEANTDKEMVVTVSQATNRAPIVKSATLTTKNNDIIKGEVSGSDADGNRLTYRAKTNPKNGKLFVKSDGVFSYIPDSEFVGTDNFSIVANDGVVDSAPATYTITVKSSVIALPTHFKYMSGYPDGKFKPEQGVTRAEIVAAIVRLTNVNGKAPAKSTYKDVKTTNWYFGALEVATQNKLMSGRTNTTFEPNSAITRSEMSNLVRRLIERGFVSGDDATLKSMNIDWLVKNGKLSTVKSATSVKRVEAVVIFNRLFKRGPLNGLNKQFWGDVPTNHPNFKDIQEASVTHEGEIRNGQEFFVRLK